MPDRPRIGSFTALTDRNARIFIRNTFPDDFVGIFQSICPLSPMVRGISVLKFWKKLEFRKDDAVWRLSARRHSSLYNTGHELIGYFASPLESREPICPVGVEFKHGRTSLSHLRKQMSFALHVAANEYKIARRCPPASLPAKRQFFRMIAIPRLSRSAGLLSMSSLESFRNFLGSSSIFRA